MVIDEKPRERGRTGQKRKPLEQKALEGNRNKEGKEGQKKFKKALKAEKTFTKANKRGVPRPPEHFGELARNTWFELFTELQLFLKTVDLKALEVYCLAWEEYREMTALLQQEGMIIYNNQMNKIQHPAYRTRDKAIDKLTVYGNMLGMNPSARQKILESGEIEDNKESENPWDFMDD